MEPIASFQLSHLLVEVGVAETILVVTLVVLVEVVVLVQTIIKQVEQELQIKVMQVVMDEIMLNQVAVVVLDKRVKMHQIFPQTEDLTGQTVVVVMAEMV
jgi:hypothetical protein